MLTTTAPFDTAAVAVVRKPKCRVTIYWTDPYLDTSIATDAGGQEARVNYPDQVADLIETVPYKWFHLDATTPLSDGMHPMPGTAAQAVDFQVGWWGKEEAGGGGTFVNPQSFEITFSARPVQTVRLVGDDKYSEYPVDFTIKIYTGAAGGSLDRTVTVTGNAAVIYSIDVSADDISDCTRMVLTITKWSGAGRVVKISEFYSNIKTVHDGDDIVSVSVMEESEIRDGTIAIGNISSNECDLALQNVEDDFFPGNLDSVLHSVIKKNRKIVVEMGFQIPGPAIEYVAMGTFWSGDWQMAELGTTATTTGRDRMELLRKTTYYPAEVTEGETLEDLATAVCEDAKLIMPDLEYSIDSALADYTIPYGWFDKKSHFNALKLIAAACQGRAYMDRVDVLQVKGPATPGIGAEDLEITADNYFQRNQPANTQDIANVIEVTTKPIEPDTASAPENVFLSKDDITMAVETATFTVTYPDKPVKDGVASLALGTATASITTDTQYAWGADITINCTIAGTLKISVAGTKFIVAGQDTIIDEDDVSKKDFGEQRYELAENELIQTRAVAETVAAALLAANKDNYNASNLDWRGNPALELGDTVKLPEYIKGSIDQRALFWVFRQVITYDGGLRATLEGRKIPGSEIEVIQDSYGTEDEWQNTYGAGAGTIQNTL